MSSSSVPRPEHPNPIFERKAWLNLNGKGWQFAIQSHSCEQPPDDWEGHIRVPFCLQAPLSGVLERLPAGRRQKLGLSAPPLAPGLGAKHVLWYKRELPDLPPAWRRPNMRILLHIGACDSSCVVRVNSKVVGRHIGGNTAFHFDVTAALHGDPISNVIFVACADKPQDGGMSPCGKQMAKPGMYGSEGPYVATLYSNITGIWQTVWLEAVPDRAYLTRVQMAPQCLSVAGPCDASASWQLQLEPSLAPGTDKAGLVFEATLFERRTCKKEVVTGSIKLASAQILALNVPAAAARLWSPEDPHLYGIKFRLYSKGQVVDEVQSYASLRTVECRRDEFFLNGEPRYLRLVLDQGYYPDGLWTAPTSLALRRDIKLAMAMGFNGARLHQKVFEPQYFAHADELGFLVFAEYPDWNGGVSNRWTVTSEYERLARNEWGELVAQLHNHPSIIAWGLFNEFGPKGGWRHHSGVGGGFWRRYPAAKRDAIIKAHCDFVKSVRRKVKQEDKQRRPIHDSSGWIHVQTDLWSFHEYQQHPERFAKILANPPAKWVAGRSGQPQIVAEYAGVGLDQGGPYGGKNPKKFLAGYAGGRVPLPQNGREALERIKALTKSIKQAPQYAGFCFTQLYDVEYEKNGVLRYDRRIKFPWSALRRIFGSKGQTGRWAAKEPPAVKGVRKTIAKRKI